MTQLWYTAATAAPLSDAGPFVGGPYRGVLHTTEGDSYAGALAAYKASGNSPHFTVSAAGVWQHVALDRAAKALAHPAGTVETNRQSAIQIEIVGHAANPSLPLGQLVPLMRWIEAQTGIVPVAPKFLPYPASYGASSVRFTARTWLGFAGWCGHQHVPGNDHGDPGAIDTASLFPPAPAPVAPTALEVDVQLQVQNVMIQTDASGNGWAKVPVQIDKVVGFLAPGLRPGADGRYGGAQVAFAQEDPNTIVSVLGWAPNTVAVVRLRVAA